MLPMNDAMKKAILDVHNKLRSDIANGKIPNYSKAANMKVLTWDQELTDRAALNVHQCEMKHDDCRSTSKTAKRDSKLIVCTIMSAHLSSYDKQVNIPELDKT